MTAEKEKTGQSSGTAKMVRAALSGAGEKRDGACPTSELMADFIEKKCSKEQAAIVLDHLGECQRCYEEWLTLRSEIDKAEGVSRHRKMLSFLATRRGLTISGSALGIAAALAVFINIYTAPMLLEKKKTQPQERPDKKVELLLEQAEQAQGEQSSTMGASVEQPGGDDEGLSMQQDLHPADKDMGSSRKGYERDVNKTQVHLKKQPSPPPALQNTEDDILLKPRSMQSEERASKEAEALVNDLLERLRRGCLAKEVGEDFWKQMYIQLSRVDRSVLKTALQGENGEDILSLTSRIVEEKASRNACPRILEILGNTTRK